MIVEDVKVIVLAPREDAFQLYWDVLSQLAPGYQRVADIPTLIRAFSKTKYEVLLVQITASNRDKMEEMAKGLGLTKETVMIVGVYEDKAPEKEDLFDFLLDKRDCTALPVVHNILRGILTLAQKVKAQTDLSAMLIHDMRSPIQSILSYSELLKEGVFGPLNEGQLRIMENALRLTDTLLELMAQLGDVLRFENKSLRIHPEWLPIKVLLQDVIQSIWIQADKKNIKFSFNGTQEGPFDVFVDRMALFRVLSNLLTNAVQHSPENSVIRLSTQRQMENGRTTCFTIHIIDSGPGIKDDEMDIIFDKFYKARAGVKKGGFGLGLYVARVYVEAHKGSIRAYNNREGGSTFQISIPVPEKKV
ncbi:MAG: hypothetical protein D6677_01280 [Calditrichaeota bacterium]|nr:MAG: hypothetical protein D6677_01280 [Calditrichota bacterium]